MNYSIEDLSFWCKSLKSWTKGFTIYALIFFGVSLALSFIAVIPIATVVYLKWVESPHYDEITDWINGQSKVNEGMEGINVPQSVLKFAGPMLQILLLMIPYNMLLLKISKNLWNEVNEMTITSGKCRGWWVFNILVILIGTSLLILGIASQFEFDSLQTWNAMEQMSFEEYGNFFFGVYGWISFVNVYLLYIVFGVINDTKNENFNPTNDETKKVPILG